MPDSVKKYVEAAYSNFRQELEERYEATDEGHLDDAVEVVDDLILAVDRAVKLTFWITLGGPNVWLEATYSADWELQEVVFQAHWGSESFRRTCGPTDPMWRLCEEHAAWLH